MQFFFLASEQAALQSADALATLGNLNVTKQTGTTCAGNYNVASGTNTSLMQTANGQISGIDWIQVISPGFSNFYIMSGSTPLNIKLGDFNAVNEGDKNSITWITTSEAKGDYFELERSANGQTFTNLATINAKGTPGTYSYVDTHPLSGINYYRLKLVNAGNYSVLSRVISVVTKSAEFSFTAYPNPVTDQLNIKVSHVADGAQLTISDLWAEM